jgi:hypothetical protein
VIAQRIDELAGHLAGDDQHGEGYLAPAAGTGWSTWCTTRSAT